MYIEHTSSLGPWALGCELLPIGPRFQCLWSLAFASPSPNRLSLRFPWSLMVYSNRGKAPMLSSDVVLEPYLRLNLVQPHVGAMDARE